ncbi:hypothetical protein BIV60_01405 [Bacillus sp. MUM 116]|uniref:hypothetical protein n=1 Tax=Bacillus sp. MUM 116 TaxID=1678002 RepID=UPI0008F5D55E|nr:hypothetical protein [Bacillus sp. MUM 116]OIK16961.1 hypothetical protein BIV60_01405 [Bacillus sp. MUM 116]
MQTIIWAFCSMIVLLLVLLFLPLGFTLKGKLFIVLSSLIISLGGLAASNTFSLPLTAILLILLIFITAYILNQRASRILYDPNQSLEENYIDIYEKMNVLEEEYIETPKATKFQELSELKSIEPNNKFTEPTNEEALDSTQTMEEGHLEVPKISPVDISLLLGEDPKQESDLHEVELDTDENNISDIENELFMEKDKKEPPKSEDGYLSELERLLIANLEESFIEDEKVEISKLNSDKKEPLEDDSKLDDLLGAKEVAIGLDKK